MTNEREIEKGELDEAKEKKKSHEAGVVICSHDRTPEKYCIFRNLCYALHNSSKHFHKGQTVTKHWFVCAAIQWNALQVKMHAWNNEHIKWRFQPNQTKPNPMKKKLISAKVFVCVKPTKIITMFHYTKTVQKTDSNIIEKQIGWHVNRKWNR